MSSSRTFNYIFVSLLLVGSFIGGLNVGKKGYDVQLKRTPPVINIINKEPQDQNVDFKIFWEVWDALNKNYLERPLDARKLLYGAISGMVNSAGDDYTAFFTPEQNKLATSSLNGVYEGIGAELGFKDKQLIVISPIEGSPAKSAGVKPGDKILEIEGATTLGLSMSDAVSKIRGPSGTVSTLKFQRADSEPFDLKITRGQIVAKSVSWKDLGEGIGYLRLARFGDSTTKQWTESVGEMLAQMPNLKGVVLDVRGNPGGYLSAATYIASEFLPIGKTVLFEETAEGLKTEQKADRKGLLLDKPVVILIDKGSASASEIVSGALYDNKRAKLVGLTSFGKGTVQASNDFDDGSSLHVTIAKWLTPNKTWVHKVGLKPDFEVEVTEEDVKAGKDPQEEKAVEVLKGELNNAKK
ncbi:MAG: S41 family peptidase [Patescibacteria group bacterium]